MVNLGPVAPGPPEGLPYYIRKGTVCLVVDRKRVLKDYTTKKDNMFHACKIVQGSGIVFQLEHEHALMTNINVMMLNDAGHITFITDEPDWPYIVVKKSLFEDETY